MEPVKIVGEFVPFCLNKINHHYIEFKKISFVKILTLIILTGNKVIPVL